MLRRYISLLGLLAFFATGIAVIALPQDTGRVVPRLLVLLSIACGGASFVGRHAQSRDDARSRRLSTFWTYVALAAGGALMWLVFGAPLRRPYEQVAIILAMIVSGGGFMLSHYFRAVAQVKTGAARS